MLHSHLHTHTHIRTPEHTHAKMKTQKRLFGILLTSHCNLQVRGHFDRLVRYCQKEAFQTETVIPKGGHGRKRLAREDATNGRPIWSSQAASTQSRKVWCWHNRWNGGQARTSTDTHRGTGSAATLAASCPEITCSCTPRAAGTARCTEDCHPKCGAS